MIGHFSEEEIHEAREAVFNTAADIMYIFDIETLQILDMNNYGLNELGYTIKEIRRFNFYDLHATEEHERVKEIIEIYRKTGEIHGVRDLHLKRKNGALIPVEKNGRITTINGKLVGHWVCRDITDQVKANQEIRKRIDDLEGLKSFALDIELARSKDELFNIIASNTIQLMDCNIVGIGLLNTNTESISINLTSIDPNLTEKKDVYEVSLDNEFFRTPILTGASKYITNYQATDETMATLVGGHSSVIIVPLKGREATTGVIWASRILNGTMFGGYDLLLLESIGGQSAIAIDNISLYDQQQFISDSLQRGFVTQILPELTKTDIGTYYASATAAAVVGGDFYDAVILPGNQIALFAGDVSGKGVTATSDAAMAKYSLRALASVNPDPKFVLAGLNKVALQLLFEDRFITLVYSLYDTSSGSMTIGLAGHPYPLLYSAATNSIKTITDENPAIAIVSKPEIVTNTILLEADDILVLYTDGIIELRREEEFFGIDRLGRIIAEYARQNAQSVADEIISYAKAFSEGNLTDDIVLMVIKRTT